MTLKKRLPWMLVASFITSAITYYLTDVTGSLARNVSNDIMSFALMMLISMIIAIATNLPSMALLWWRKYPDSILVALLASVEGLFLSYMIIPIAESVIGIGYWALLVFVSIFIGYVVIDGVINQSKQPKRIKMITVGTILVVTALILAAFLKGWLFV